MHPQTPQLLESKINLAQILKLTLVLHNKEMIGPKNGAQVTSLL